MNTNSLSRRGTTNDRTATLLLATLALVAIGPEASAWQATTTRTSVTTGGAQANNDTSIGRMTSDGRFIVFTSHATDLVPNDTNNQPDGFLRDRLANTTTRITVDASGNQALGGSSGDPSISTDGRFVAFVSGASNLVATDTNNATDVFLKDLQTGAVSLVDLRPGGVQTNSLSQDPRISANGLVIAYQSFDTGLVTGDTNNKSDVFVKDLQTGVTTRISVNSAGVQGDGDSGHPLLSGDGRFVVFSSESTNLAANDTNGALQDLFVHDRQTGQTTLVNVNSAGVQSAGGSGTASISENGRFITFASNATNLSPNDTNNAFDVFLRDLQTGTTTLISTDSNGVQGNQFSIYGALSADGRYVAIDSIASNLAPGDTNGNLDVFLKDRVTNVTTRISVSTGGVGGNFGSFSDSVSADGRFVSFTSECTNLVASDTNNHLDTFLRDRGAPMPFVYCTAKLSSLGCLPAIGFSGTPSVTSTAPFLVTASTILNNRFGGLVYGFSQSTLPFAGGTLCVGGVLRRTGILNAGGNPPPANDCSGGFSFNFNARIQSGIDPMLTVGNTVDCQYFYRNSASTGGIGLTDAVEFVIGP